MAHVVYLTWVKYSSSCADNSFHGYVPENMNN